MNRPSTDVTGWDAEIMAGAGPMDAPYAPMPEGDDFAAADAAYWRTLKLHRADGAVIPLPDPTPAQLDRHQTRFMPTGTVPEKRQHVDSVDGVRKIYGIPTDAQAAKVARAAAAANSKPKRLGSRTRRRSLLSVEISS